MGDYPVRFDAEYPESPSRWLALLGALFWLKGLLLLPHVVALFFLGIIAFIAYYVAYVVVLVTGSYPRGSSLTFTVGVQRWSARTDSWMNGLTDQYPPSPWARRSSPSGSAWTIRNSRRGCWPCWG